MARNRRKNKLRVRPRKAGVHGVIPGTLFGVLVMMSLVALGYLYLCGRCDDLGKKIGELESRRVSLASEIVNEQFKWSKLTTPEKIQELLDKHELSMIWPSEDSILRVNRNPLPHSVYARRPGSTDLAHD